MILPSKHISEEQSLLGVSVVVLKYLKKPQTVTSLWDKLRDEQIVGTYERFVLALDMLYILGIINMYQGMIRKEKP